MATFEPGIISGGEIELRRRLTGRLEMNNRINLHAKLARFLTMKIILILSYGQFQTSLWWAGKADSVTESMT